MARTKRAGRWGALLLSLLALDGTAGAQTPLRTTGQICDQFENRINKLIAANKHLDAILAATQYERDLIARYAKPTFKKGAFGCEGHGLSFDCPQVADWREADVTEPKMREFLRSLTLDRLLVLREENEGAYLILTSLDTQRYQRRMGDRKNPVDEKTLQILRKSWPSSLAPLRSRSSKRLPINTCCVSPSSPPTPTRTCNSRSSTTTGRHTSGSCWERRIIAPIIKKRLAAVLAAVKIAKRDDTPVDAVRANLKDFTDLSQLLACVRGLAEIGEYREAALELSSLRAEIAQSLPKSTNDGKVARNPSYGITLMNPDAVRWTLSASQKGVMPSLMLEDTSNKPLAAISVSVLNPLLVAGPPALEYMGPDAKPEARREVLRSSALGALIGQQQLLGGQIDSDKYRKFKDLSAFEAVATFTRVPGLKGKVLVIDRPSGFVMVNMLGTAENLAEYEKLLDTGLLFDEK